MPSCTLCFDGLIYPDVNYEDAETITVGDKTVSLNQSLKLRQHSPTGFSWGYGGSGPSQLALAILYTLTNDPDEALRWYMDFKDDVVSHLFMGVSWEIEFDFDQWKWYRKTGEGSTGIEFVSTVR